MADDEKKGILETLGNLSEELKAVLTAVAEKAGTKVEVVAGEVPKGRIAFYKKEAEKHRFGAKFFLRMTVVSFLITVICAVVLSAASTNAMYTIFGITGAAAFITMFFALSFWYDENKEAMGMDAKVAGVEAAPHEVGYRAVVDTLWGKCRRSNCGYYC